METGVFSRKERKYSCCVFVEIQQWDFYKLGNISWNKFYNSGKGNIAELGECEVKGIIYGIGML